MAEIKNSQSKLSESDQLKTGKESPPKGEPKSTREIELEAQLAQAHSKAEAEKIEAEKAAVAKVCEAVGIDPKSLEAHKAATDLSKELREFDIGTQVVSINGFRFTGRGQATADVVEVILSAAGAARMRKLREKIGNDHEVRELASGTITSRVIRQSPESLV